MLSLATKTPKLSSNLCRYTLSSVTRQKRIKLAIRWHGGPKVESNAPTVQITFINPHPAATRQKSDTSEDDNRLTVDARVGETLLQTAHRHDIDLEGACEGGELSLDCKM